MDLEELRCILDSGFPEHCMTLPYLHHALFCFFFCPSLLFLSLSFFLFSFFFFCSGNHAKHDWF